MVRRLDTGRAQIEVKNIRLPSWLLWLPASSLLATVTSHTGTVVTSTDNAFPMLVEEGRTVSPFKMADNPVSPRIADASFAGGTTENFEETPPPKKKPSKTAPVALLFFTPQPPNHPAYPPFHLLPSAYSPSTSSSQQHHRLPTLSISTADFSLDAQPDSRYTCESPNQKRDAQPLANATKAKHRVICLARGDKPPIVHKWPSFLILENLSVVDLAVLGVLFAPSSLLVHVDIVELLAGNLIFLNANHIEYLKDTMPNLRHKHPGERMFPTSRRKLIWEQHVIVDR